MTNDAESSSGRPRSELPPHHRVALVGDHDGEAARSQNPGAAAEVASGTGPISG